MRVLHVFGKMDRGGAETGLVRLLRHIDRESYQTDILVHTTEPGTLDDAVRSLGARIISCPSYSQPLRYARNLARIVRQYGPYDIVHSHVHLYSGYILGIAFALGIPIRIAHAHTTSNNPRGSGGVSRELYVRAVKAAIAMFATGGFAVSRECAESLFPPIRETNNRWKVLHSGIDLEPFAVCADQKALRKDLGLTSASVVIGHVGRFDDGKNHSFFVDTALMFLKEEPKAMFLLVGDGPLRARTEERVRELGVRDRFVFLGVRTDVPSLMIGAMDALLFPSKFEGLPITILEAQAAALPCVVSDVITKECDVLHGIVRRLSLLQGPQVWARALAATLREPRLTATQVRSAMDYWSAEHSAQRLANAYHELVPGTGAARA